MVLNPYTTEHDFDKAVRVQVNRHDRFAVAIRKGTLTVGHVPAEIFFFFFFLRRGGTVNCRVSTERRRRSPLEQGGLEEPCELIFVADDLAEATHKVQYLHAPTIFVRVFYILDHSYQLQHGITQYHKLYGGRRQCSQIPMPGISYKGNK